MRQDDPDGHDFDLGGSPDREGTDSWRHRAAGARASAVFSARRWALFRDGEPELETLLDLMCDMDLILAEGLKGSEWPKVVVLGGRAGPDSPAGLGRSGAGGRQRVCGAVLRPGRRRGNRQADPVRDRQDEKLSGARAVSISSSSAKPGLRARLCYNENSAEDWRTRNAGEGHHGKIS